jgi:hypothetical protein
VTEEAGKLAVGEWFVWSYGSKKSQHMTFYEVDAQLTPGYELGSCAYVATTECPSNQN